MKEMSPEAVDRGIACLRRMRRIADSFDATLRAVATSAVREASQRRHVPRPGARRGRHRDRRDLRRRGGAADPPRRAPSRAGVRPAHAARRHRRRFDGGRSSASAARRSPRAASSSAPCASPIASSRAAASTRRRSRRSASTSRGVLSHFQRDVDRHGFDVAVASSGTAEAVARMVHAATGAEPLRTYNCYEFTTPELAGVVAELVGRRTAAARAKVPGLEAGRADIVVAGALILETVATMFGVERFTFSEAALRDGVLRRHGRPDRAATGALHHLARRVAAQHPPARRALRRRPGALGARRPPRRRAVRRARAAARPRRGGAGVPRGGRAARQRRPRRRPQQAPPARLLRDPQQRAGRADRPGDRDRRPDRPLPPQERAEAVAPRVRRASTPATRSWCGRWPGSCAWRSASTAATAGGSPSVRAEVHPKRVVVLADAEPGADIGLELYAANERKALLERVLDRRVDADPRLTASPNPARSAGRGRRRWSVVVGGDRRRRGGRRCRGGRLRRGDRRRHGRRRWSRSSSSWSSWSSCSRDRAS